MTKTTMFAGPFGEIAVHESEGVGRPVILVHGNSSSARAFSRQLEGPLEQIPLNLSRIRRERRNLHIRRV
jgi:hypothetical protein